jgi:Skp family chaperone for outer membrane proteins
VHISRFLTAALAIAAALPLAPAAMAQQNPGWFVPGQQHAPARPAAPRPAPAPAPGPAPSAAEQQLPQPPAPLQVPLPPEPTVPDIAKGEPPPTPVIGVLGVPDVMRASTAAQAVEKIIGERRQKLNEDAQKEQTAWRDTQQQIASQRSKLSAEQVREKEKGLQDRIAKAQQDFRARNQLIQEDAQFALAQIERTLVQVIRKVADSRGMNLVLHRAQVALNIAQFDITQQVTEELNKILPSVEVPPEGVSPADFMKGKPHAPDTAAVTPTPPAPPAAPPAKPAQAKPAN